MYRLKDKKEYYVVPLWIKLAAAVCLSCLWAHSAMAAGTSAGTTITNTATVTFTLSSDPTPRSATTANTFDVLEIIDIVVTWQDAVDVPVSSPHADAVSTYQITNTGNGPESFVLLTDDTLGGDDFDPAVQTVWVESNGSPGLQNSGATPDTQYMGGGVLLNADGALTAYVLSNIPAGLVDTNIGRVGVTAESTTPGAAGAPPGTEIAGAGVGGNAIVGATNADGNAQGAYAVSAPRVDLAKSVVLIIDPYGGNQPYTSAQLTYRILVDVTGSGMAQGLVITDVIPANTTYVPGSITLDAVSQTDADDAPADGTDFNVTTANTVTVNMGNTMAPASRTIEFSVTIN